MFNGGRCTTCSTPWPIMVGDKKVGDITSAIWSPRLEANVGLSMIDREFWKMGQIVSVQMPENNIASGKIVELPF